MSLKSRQMSMLRTLSAVVNGIPLASLMSEYGVSRRTVYYDISTINNWLYEHDLGSVSIDRQFLLDSGVRWERVARLIGLTDARPLSVQERRSMIFLRIALSDEQETIGSLMTSFEVSRNTVIADLRDLK